MHIETVSKIDIWYLTAFIISDVHSISEEVCKMHFVLFIQYEYN